MKIYSYQPVSLVQKIFEDGIVYPKKNIIFPSQDFELVSFFKKSYDWMNQKLQQKTPKPPQADYPFWGYYQWNGIQKVQPDLRSSEAKNYCKKQPYCLLHLEIPDNEVLLSDYDAWHFVLNCWYLTSNSMRELKEQELNQQGLSLYKQEQLSQDILHLIQSSWDNVFDLETAATLLEISTSQSTIQATFWSILKEYLQKIIVFDGKSQRQFFNKKNFHIFQTNYIGDFYVNHD